MPPADSRSRSRSARSCGRQLVGVAGQQAAGSATRRSAPVRDVEDPQPVDRVLRTGRAQEDHPVAVRGDGHRAGRAVGEAAGAGGQLRIVHPGMVTRAPAGCHADRDVECRRARRTVAAGDAPTRPARRILFVHAHPDDEAIGTGATMAHYAAAGAHVTLVTCTLGEEGEIHVPALAGLAADRGRPARRLPDRRARPRPAPRSASPTTGSSAAPAATATPG